MTALTVRTPQDRRDWQACAGIKERLYPDLPGIQEEAREESRRLQRLSRRDPFRRLRVFLAWRGEEPVGRIAAIADARHRPGDEGFFGFFECENDPEAAGALLAAAARQLKAWGKKSMLGPISASTNEKVGILMEGFDTWPHPNLAYNPPYYRDLLTGCGLEKAMGLLSYLWTRDLPVPERMALLKERALRRRRVELHFPALDPRPEEAVILRDVYNESLQNNWGFVPLSFAEAKDILRWYRHSGQPELLLRLDVEGEPAGTCFLQPNPRAGFNPSVPPLRAAVLGLRPKFRNQGLSAVLIDRAMELAQAKGYHRAEVSLIMENNVTVRRLVEHTLGCPVLHRYEVYRTEVT